MDLPEKKGRRGREGNNLLRRRMKGGEKEEELDKEKNE